MIKKNIKNPSSKFFCSWSGGKDSALALYKAIQSGIDIDSLHTMMIETGDRSRSHGIKKDVLEAQASCIGLPISFCSTSWDNYTENYLKHLDLLKRLGINAGIFGDIDIESHLQWVENVCHSKKMQAILPLWQMTRLHLLEELLQNGFKAEIIAVKDQVLPKNYLGRVLNNTLICEFQNLGIDLCGENGEYHTLVTDGPFFNQPLKIQHGDQVLKDGYWFSDVSLERTFL